MDVLGCAVPEAMVGRLAYHQLPRFAIAELNGIHEPEYCFPRVTVVVPTQEPVYPLGPSARELLSAIARENRERKPG